MATRHAQDWSAFYLQCSTIIIQTHVWDHRFLVACRLAQGRGGGNGRTDNRWGVGSARTWDSIERLAAAAVADPPVSVRLVQRQHWFWSVVMFQAWQGGNYKAESEDGRAQFFSAASRRAEAKILPRSGGFWHKVFVRWMRRFAGSWPLLKIFARTCWQRMACGSVGRFLARVRFAFMAGACGISLKTGRVAVADAVLRKWRCAHSEGVSHVADLCIVDAILPPAHMAYL